MTSWDLKNKASSKRGQVWEFRNNEDLYTKRDMEWVEKRTGHVEHILELKLLNKAWHKAWYDLRTTNVPAASTREAYKQLNKVGSHCKQNSIRAFSGL